LNRKGCNVNLSRFERVKLLVGMGMLMVETSCVDS
jgi:hypothetical protein